MSLRCLPIIVLWSFLAIGRVPAAEPFRQVLSSASRNVSLPTWVASNRDVTPGCPTPWVIRKRTLHGGKQEGVELIVVDNGRLRFVVAPTRGMGIMSVHSGDVRLGWDSPIKDVVHPQFVNLASRNGLGWLEGFNEWMCRCGIESFGSPGPDKMKNEAGQDENFDLTLHGKIANQPAREVEVVVDREPPYRLRIRGVVDEKMFHGPKFELHSEISTEPGSNSFRIADEVKNTGGQPQEFEMLYHGNYGKPLLEDGAMLVAPIRQVLSADKRAAKDAKDFAVCQGPTPGFIAPVYCFHLYGDSRDRTLVMFQNKAKDRAVSMAYSLKEIPCLTMWKNTVAESDGYVTGVEPGTNFPFHRSVERQAGRVMKLQPGSHHHMALDFTIHADKADVAATARKITAIQAGRPTKIEEEPVKKE